MLTPDELQNMKEGDMIVIPSMKRRNLKGERIEARPVLAAGDNAMKYRYEYLSEFDPDADIPYDRLPYSQPLSEVNLENLYYLPQNLEQAGNLPKKEENTDYLYGEKLKLVERRLDSVGIYFDELETIPIVDLRDRLLEFYQMGTLSDDDYLTLKKLLQ